MIKKIVFFYFLLLIASSCDSKKTESNQQNVFNNTFDEQKFEEERKKYEEIELRLTIGVDKKIEKLNFSKASSIHFISLNDTEALASCPVKKTYISSFNSDGTPNIVVEDKTYVIKVYFRKYNDYEIVKVELWDEGNGTKQILE